MLSTYHTNTSYQHTLSTYPINTLYQHTQWIFPINRPFYTQKVVWETTIEISESLVQGYPPTLPPTPPRSDGSGDGGSGAIGNSRNGSSSDSRSRGSRNSSGDDSGDNNDSSDVRYFPSMQLYWDASSLWPIPSALNTMTDAQGEMHPTSPSTLSPYPLHSPFPPIFSRFHGISQLWIGISIGFTYLCGVDRSTGRTLCRSSTTASRQSTTPSTILSTK